MSAVGKQLTRMMWWRRRAFYPVVALMLAAVASAALSLAREWSGQIGLVALDLDLAFLGLTVFSALSALAIGLCWVVTLWHIFWAGTMAFGAWSGLFYTLLGFVLSPWPGLYVVPHMVRLDAKRLLGVEPDEAEENAAEPAVRRSVTQPPRGPSMIRFTCECGHPLQVRDEQAGGAVACPACGRRQTVPASSTAVQPERDPAGAAEGEAAPPGSAVTSGRAVASLVLGFLSLCTFLLAGLPAIILAVLALGDVKRGRGRVKGRGLAITGLVLGIVGTLATCRAVPLALQKTRESADRTESMNNLKRMCLAMHNYHDNYGRIPPAGSRGLPGRPGDKPLLSWRVAILPEMGYVEMYKQINQNEPWDGPNNIRVQGRVPTVYRMPGEQPGPGGLTKYQVFVGPGTAFGDRPDGASFPADFPDGMANTLLVVEAANGVPWSKPEDLPFNPDGPLPPLGGRFPKGFIAVFADGHTALIPRDTPEKTIKALITRNGGETVTPP